MQLPGREQRAGEQPFRNMAALVDALLHFLRGELELGPFALFGHSLGAKIAFELARALSDAGTAPEVLIVSGCAGPGVRDPRPPIAELPDAEFWAKVGELQGTPDAVLQDAELRRFLAPCLRADYHLSERYAPSASSPLDVPIWALGGESDPEASLDELLAWRACTRGAFATQSFPGDHFYLVHSREALLQFLKQRLGRKREASPRTLQANQST